MSGKLCPTPPIRSRSRRQQELALWDLKAVSPTLRHVQWLLVPVKLLIFFAILYFALPPVNARMGSWGGVGLCVVTMLLVQEVFWRRVTVPLMEKELQRHTARPIRRR